MWNLKNFIEEPLYRKADCRGIDESHENSARVAANAAENTPVNDGPFSLADDVA
jgi:hypothetical protein